MSRYCIVNQDGEVVVYFGACVTALLTVVGLTSSFAAIARKLMPFARISFALSMRNTR